MIRQRGKTMKKRARYFHKMSLLKDYLHERG